MKLETTRRIRCVLPDGTEAVLLPGTPVELPIAAARDLLLRAPTFVRPASPIKVGWFILHKDHKEKLRGGVDDPAYGEVVATQFNGIEWKFTTKNNCTVEASRVCGVTKVDAQGVPTACWTVRGHGLDGEGTQPRRLLSTLAPDQQQKFRDAFQLSERVFDALSTGHGPQEIWDEFWGGGRHE